MLKLIKSDFGNGRMPSAMFRYVPRCTGIPDRHTGCRGVCRSSMSHLDRALCPAADVVTCRSFEDSKDRDAARDHAVS